MNRGPLLRAILMVVGWAGEAVLSRMFVKNGVEGGKIRQASLHEGRGSVLAIRDMDRHLRVEVVGQATLESDNSAISDGQTSWPLKYQ